jgi:hypothetical protein
MMWSIDRMKVVRSRKCLVFSIVVAVVILVPLSLLAEEGGSGHYTPGAAASFIDALPDKPGLAVANYFNYYDGSASISRPLPIGGMATAGLDATAYSDTILALYTTPLKLLGGYYTVGAAIPYIWLKVKGNIHAKGPQGQAISRAGSDTANGIGDILLYPFLLGWNGLNGDLKYDVRMGVRPHWLLREE